MEHDLFILHEDHTVVYRLIAILVFARFVFHLHQNSDNSHL